MPLVTVRVFNDGGSFGTTGFTEEAVLPAEALGAGQRGVLVAPIDTALYRFNVGVRSLASGATLSIVVRNAAGTVTRYASTRTYAPSYFEQRDSAAFLDGAAISANDTITVQVTPARRSSTGRPWTTARTTRACSSPDGFRRAPAIVKESRR